MTTDNNLPHLNEHMNKNTPDWLDEDPLGLNVTDPDFNEETYAEETYVETTYIGRESIKDKNLEDDIAHTESADTFLNDAQPLPEQQANNSRLPISNDITQSGKRYLILDTETTGFGADSGDRMVEIGILEMIDRKLTGNTLHLYINPKREVGDSANIHGLTDEFLADKPTFSEVAQQINDFVHQAGIIAHNAKFDMSFLEMEFAKAKLPPLAGRVEVIDSLALAKQKHPTQKNSLDALAKRYDVKARDRTFHGALLDAEILADVYLAMTGGQVALLIDDNTASDQIQNHQHLHITGNRPVVIKADDNELAAQTAWINQHIAKRAKEGKTDDALWLHLGDFVNTDKIMIE